MFKHKHLFIKHSNMFVHYTCGWYTSSGRTNFAWRTDRKQRKSQKLR